MLPKTSSQSLSLVDAQRFNLDELYFYRCFHDVRQAHINIASLLSDVTKDFVLTDTMVEKNAELYGRLIDLERDYIKFFKMVQSENHISI